MSIFKKDNEINAESLTDSGRKIHINVQDHGVNSVNVSLPLEFIKKVAKVGNGISGIVGGGSLENVKLDEILSLAEDGITGEIVNVVSADGSTVSISIE